MLSLLKPTLQNELASKMVYEVLELVSKEYVNENNYYALLSSIKNFLSDNIPKSLQIKSVQL